MPTDQELIRRIRDGDSDAVAELYHRYAPLVWRYVYARMQPDLHAGQDVLSETFLAAMRALRNGTEKENLAGWLTAIARNKSADWYRQQAKLATCPLEHDVAASDNQGVGEVLAMLAEEKRVVLEWKYLDGSTVREIAARLGKTAKAVETLLYRARRSFRAHYQTTLK